MSRTSTRASSASYSSTANLVPHESEKSHKPMAHKLFDGWKHGGDRGSHRELEAQRSDQSPYDKGGGARPPLRPWHGWNIILFDSWFNLLIFLIPVAGIIKLTTEDAEKLVFSACLLAMIPLVKLHDLSTRILSRRIGGTKTGLLNSSMIIALRKCELRVVQSSQSSVFSEVIGAMLSKLLLILGMCFFAGGLRFSEQGFDSTFHFALTYSNSDGDQETTIQEQKQDILRMSHGVAVVLLFIYVSYLVFQLWSHTHFYQDSVQPSKQLQVPGSVRSATARVRQKSSSIAERITHNRSFELLRTASATPLRTIRHKTSGVLRPVSPQKQTAISPVEELPETSFDVNSSHRSAGGTSPYLHSSGFASGSGVNVNSRTALLSPYGSASRVTLANPIAQPADSVTVRLVPEQARFVVGPKQSGSSSDSGDSRPGSPTSGSGDDSFESDVSAARERRASWSQTHARQQPGRSRTPVSAVLSAYYQESIRGEDGQMQHGSATGGRGLVASPGQYYEEPTTAEQEPAEREMSWPLLLFVLSAITVLVAVNAEWMVDSMDHLSPTISKEWIGLILLPTVSALAECITAINVSVKDQLTLSISVAVGSTIQTALFVIPSMVILGWILDKPLALLFDPFESVVLYISVHTMGYVVADGKSNWLEGVILVCLYIVIAVTFWFYPGSNFSTTLAVCTESPPIAL
ncbi:Sodium/calcium exchanger protein-domain-containing protein [Daedaleopsis nitida]|nr:Sodium/calcium exchanger protein-domain-containing protein [Daedaleopsis nitida]